MSMHIANHAAIIDAHMGGLRVADIESYHGQQWANTG